MVGRFVEVYKRRGLKVNAGDSMETMLIREEVCVEGIGLEYVSEFKYLNIWDAFWMTQSVVGRW